MLINKISYLILGSLVIMELIYCSHQSRCFFELKLELIVITYLSFCPLFNVYGAPEGTRKLKSFEWLDCTNNKVLNVAIAQIIKF